MLTILRPREKTRGDFRSGAKTAGGRYARRRSAALLDVGKRSRKATLGGR